PTRRSSDLRRDIVSCRGTRAVTSSAAGPSRVEYLHRMREHLPLRVGRFARSFRLACMYCANDVHALDDLAERGEAEPVGEPCAAEIEGGLVAYADEERRAAPGAGLGTRQGDDAVRVTDAGVPGRLVRDRRRLRHVAGQPALD